MKMREEIKSGMALYFCLNLSAKPLFLGTDRESVWPGEAYHRSQTIRPVAHHDRGAGLDGGFLKNPMVSVIESNKASIDQTFLWMRYASDLLVAHQKESEFKQ